MAQDTASTPPQGLPDASQLPTLEIGSNSPLPTRPSSGSSFNDEGAISEYGRTYHHYNADSYLLPNDAAEQERLDLQHYIMLRLLEDKLFLAPIDVAAPGKALDIGTGTGIWPNQFAGKNLSWQVIGTDLSLIQAAGVAENCSFVREDAEKDVWVFDEPFDYIHARHFCSFVTDIRAIIKKAYDNLKPGGWIEFQELTHEFVGSDESYEGSSFQTFCRITTSVAASRGRNPWAMIQLKQMFTALGFVNVKQKVLPVPVGGWPKDAHYRRIGRMHAINIGDALDSSIKFAMAAGLTEGQAQTLINNAKAEVEEGNMCAQNFLYVVYGQKPM